MPSRAQIDEAFRTRERMLWALCYRLTGVAADADEIVQETFARALERSPSGGDADWHRWLVRVATNLSIDYLRARKRRAYPGVWLPSPIETAELVVPDESAGVAERYERLESVSYAFLVALEALGPRSRAVLILRDVFDYPASEVARLLATSEANVRVLHHRARRTIADREYERPPMRALAGETRRALEAFVGCLMRQDVAGIQALLTDAVRTLTDGGGEYTALRTPLVGKGPVARFHLETGRRRAPISRFEIRTANGLPALVIETAATRPRMAPRLVLRCEVGADGRIRELHTILASRKLTAIRFTGV